MTGEFIEWCRRNGGAKRREPSLYPWMDATRSIACGWCDLPLGDCRCFGPCEPAEPARPIDIAAFLASLPKWCRECRGLLPCDCRWNDRRKVWARRYYDKCQTARRCVRCVRPSPDGAVCETCRERSRAYQQELYAGREAAGRCKRCGSGDHTSSDHYKRIHEAKIASGNCITCGRDRGTANRQCQPCREVDADRNRAKRAAASSVPRRAGPDTGAGLLESDR